MGRSWNANIWNCGASVAGSRARTHSSGDGPNVILRTQNEPPTGARGGSIAAYSGEYDMPAGFTNHWAERGDGSAVPSLSWYSAAVPAAASDAAVSCAAFRPAVTAAMSSGSSAAESRTRYQSS